MATLAVKAFLEGRRVLYATPTQDQHDAFWFEVKRALEEPIAEGVLYKNETRHFLEVPGTQQRIRAKTAYNADTLRGDFGDLVILDEFQDMDEDALDLVVFPMLLDNNGDLVLIYTSKRGKSHARAYYKKALEDTAGRWASFVFTSLDNPYLSREALDAVSADMTNLAYRAEILAEDIEDDPSALWSRDLIRRVTGYPDLYKLYVGVDPAGSSGQTGIVVAGAGKMAGEDHVFVLSDRTSPVGAKPHKWGRDAVAAYIDWKADRILGEVNHGGDMVENVIRNVPNGKTAAFKMVRASRGKEVRAEPVQALYEKGQVHHVGDFPELEDEMCNWVPGESKWSPNRLDAMVWAVTELGVKPRREMQSTPWGFYGGRPDNVSEGDPYRTDAEIEAEIKRAEEVMKEAGYG